MNAYINKLSPMHSMHTRTDLHQPSNLLQCSWNLKDKNGHSPARLRLTVIRSPLYSSRGSVVWSPILKAVEGVVGVMRASTSLRAASISSRTTFRICSQTHVHHEAWKYYQSTGKTHAKALRELIVRDKGLVVGIMRASTFLRAASISSRTTFRICSHTQPQ